MTDVLYTGGTGRMGRVLREGLAGEFRRVVLYVRRPPEELHAGEEAVIGDLADLDALEAAARGIEAIVHLGGIADEAPFADILDANVVGTYHVFEAARRAGVRRVVFASSNHVTGFYPDDRVVAASDPPRPDSYYGVSKVFGEALGRLYHDKWGLEVVCLRIGTFRPAPEDQRQRGMWLSHRDGAQLIRAAVLAEEVGFTVLYGASANGRSFWDNGGAAARIGYRPVDDAEDHVAAIPPSSPGHEPTGLQGGGFTPPDYRGGLW